MDMSFIDIVIVLMALGGIAVGWKRGIVRCLGGVAGIVLGIVACHLLGKGQSVAVNVLIFAAAYIIVVLCSRGLSKLVHALFLGPFDRLLGAAFVAFEYLVGLSVLLNLYVWARSLAGTPDAALAADSWGQRVLELMPWLTGCLSTLNAQHLL